mgnify:CR=1 FL=1|jgi:hypothetical protein
MAAYRLEHRTYATPKLPFLPVSYIITMEGSDRRERYLRELERQPLTKHVVVVHNKGFRRCPKVGVSSSVDDLWDANRFVFDHCADVEAPIIVLEDDATLDVLTDEDVAQLHRLTHSDFETVFLGAWPWLSRRSGAVLRLHLAGMAHCVMYSHAAREFLRHKTLPRALGYTVPHDLYVSFSTYACTLRTPVAFQPHEHTANAQTWDPTGALRTYFAAWNAAKRPQHMTRFHHRLGVFGGSLPLLILGCIVASLTSPNPRWESSALIH